MTKTLKTLKFTTFLACCFLLLTSCEPEEPTTPGGGNNTDNITGTWGCSESSQEFGPSSYEVTITKSPSSSNQVRIQNFYQLPGSFVAVNVNGNNLSIPQQTVESILFSGSGTIVNQNRINLNFTADDGGGVIDQVSAGLSR